MHSVSPTQARWEKCGVRRRRVGGGLRHLVLHDAPDNNATNGEDDDDEEQADAAKDPLHNDPVERHIKNDLLRLPAQRADIPGFALR